MPLIFLCAILMVSQAEGSAIAEKQILGDWCAGSRESFHEEFSLTVDGGAHRFESWLHERPALSGSWTLSGRSLKIVGRNGDRLTYRVQSVSGQRLVLHAAGARDDELYVRPGKCVAFEMPPEE